MPTHPLKYPSLSRPRKLLFGLMALSLIGVSVCRAQQFECLQITPETKVPNITISLTKPSENAMNLNAPLGYIEARPPIRSGNYVAESIEFPTSQMRCMRVEVVDSNNTTPLIGTLLIYQEDKLVAACHVASRIVESQPDPDARKNASNPTKQNTVFEFPISPALIANSKFEIQMYSLPETTKVKLFPHLTVIWFYVKDFLPKQ